MKVITKKSVFEVKSNGNATIEVRKVKDCTRGKISKFKEGTALTGHRLPLGIRIGIPLTLEKNNTIIFRSGPIQSFYGSFLE
jgi:hypothetical protein